MTIHILRHGNRIWITKNPDFSIVSAADCEPAVVVYAPVGTLFPYRVRDGSGGSFWQEDSIEDPQLGGLPGF